VLASLPQLKTGRPKKASDKKQRATNMTLTLSFS
jgi:hypothetical protein